MIASGAAETPILLVGIVETPELVGKVKVYKNGRYEKAIRASVIGGWADVLLTNSAGQFIVEDHPEFGQQVVRQRVYGNVEIRRNAA